MNKATPPLRDRLARAMIDPLNREIQFLPKNDAFIYDGAIFTVVEIDEKNSPATGWTRWNRKFTPNTGK